MDKNTRRPAAPAPKPLSRADEPAGAGSVFVPSGESLERHSRRGRWIGLVLLAIVLIAGVGIMVAWPRLRPRPRNLDAVERVARDYLGALVRQDREAASRLSTVDEPPAIRSVGSLAHDRKQ